LSWLQIRLAAAGRICNQLKSELNNHRYRLGDDLLLRARERSVAAINAAIGQLQRPPAPAPVGCWRRDAAGRPTVRPLDVYRGLVALDREFGGTLQFHRNGALVAVTTPRIVYPDYGDLDFGPFRLELQYAPYDREGGAHNYLRAFALEPNPAHGRRDIVHPHVLSSGEICYGTAQGLVVTCLAHGAIYDALLTTWKMLETWAPDSQPYVHPGRWRPPSRTRCRQCGVDPARDPRSCPDCGNPSCAACRRTCARPDCGHAGCGHCMRACGDCDRTCCRDCLTVCRDCDRTHCRACADASTAFVACTCGHHLCPGCVGTTCAGCDRALCEDCEGYSCEDCDVEFCSDCSEDRRCTVCRNVHCDEHAEECDCGHRACSGCRTVNEDGVTRCSDCGRECAGCGTAVDEDDAYEIDGESYCDGCAVECRGCATTERLDDTAEICGWHYCSDCWTPCAACDAPVPNDDVLEIEDGPHAGLYCEDCAGPCPGCDEVVLLEQLDADGSCAACREDADPPLDADRTHEPSTSQTPAATATATATVGSHD
jgi:hypothetical protein